jgi:invasion protein IalB
MIRTILIAIALFAVLGGGAWYMFGRSDAQEMSGVSAAAGSATPGSMANAAPTEFWTKRCEEKIAYCEIFQRLSIKENNQRLVEFAVGYPKDMKGAAQAVIILPLGVTVTDGIAIKVDDQAPATAKFRSCNPDGCYVILTLPDTIIQSMASGKKITVSFLDGAGKQLNVEMSLSGFGGKLQTIKA